MSCSTLVTGATGFLGRHLVQQALARGDRVRALCRRHDAQLQNWGSEIFLGDIRDRHAVETACRGVEVVHHVAGVAGIWGPWQRYYEVNTLGTEHVLAACRSCGVERLVYTSSPSVTFDGRPQEGVDETAAYASRWLCHYPHSKALAEQAVLAANEPGRLRTCALRPHLIWGPGDRHLVIRLLARARRGRLRRVGDGRNLIDTVYVENAAAAHLRAADSLGPTAVSAGRAYFISQGRPVNCWEWIDQLLALAGLPAVSKTISLPAARRVGAVLEGMYRTLRIAAEPPMTRFLASQLGTSHYFNISRAQQDFGYEAEVTTEEGMRRLGAWLVDQVI
jgi:nucleoside-diphosphate-sugar epimerase